MLSIKLIVVKVHQFLQTHAQLEMNNINILGPLNIQRTQNNNPYPRHQNDLFCYIVASKVL